MNLQQLRPPPELQAFIIVGSASAAVHFCSVLTIVQFFKLAPLLANLVGFFISFQVSYFGHRFWTFADTSMTHAQSFPRFFLVSFSSFLINETMYYFLLRYAPIPYWLSLGIVLVLVAVLTFILGRFWAFSKHD